MTYNENGESGFWAVDGTWVPCTPSDPEKNDKGPAFPDAHAPDGTFLY